MPDFGDQGSGGGRHDWYGSRDPNAPSVENGQISPAQWEAYKRQRRKAALIGYLSTVGGMLGAQPLANAAGIGAGAGGGAAGSASGMPAGYVPGWEGNTAIVGGAAGGAGGAGAAGAAGAGAGGFGLRDAISLGLAGAGAVGGAMSNPPDYSPNSMATDPQMAELLQLMSGRIKKSEPLYDSILQMANGLLPTQYQRGGGGMG